ncbi:hypothetical protein MVEN_02120000 [Mycena venus]|uniref:Uncharacterized protein n=1 Tax=Mycena venus TaxID=2733690 RepID=A0A8H6X9T8_9AGAR|nr:hypothetical protein MVEN_02120000 [Mycena venus]
MPHSLHESTERAEDLRTWCSMTPDMNAFRPIAASALDVCRAAADMSGNREAERLAARVVGETEKLINRMATLPLSPNVGQNVQLFATKLQEIQRFVEQIPRQSKNKAKLIMGHIFNTKTRRLKAELKDLSHAFLEDARISSGNSDLSCGEYILELATLGVRTASAICDAPGLNLLQPAVDLAGIICETAKSAKSNRETARELAKHSSAVIKCIVDCASKMDVSSMNNGEALVALKSALEDVQTYLNALRKPRRRMSSWMLANQEKERIAELTRALDKALALFTATNTVNIYAEVCSHTRQLTIIRANLAPSTEREKMAENQTITAFVPSLTALHSSPFFLGRQVKGSIELMKREPQPFEVIMLYL